MEKARPSGKISIILRKWPLELVEGAWVCWPDTREGPRSFGGECNLRGYCLTRLSLLQVVVLSGLRPAEAQKFESDLCGLSHLV